MIRSISEISSCCFGPRPWHIEIRHRVKKTFTINLFGFETLKLKFRRLKLWKPTVFEDVVFGNNNYVASAASSNHTCSIIIHSKSNGGYYICSIIIYSK